MTREPLLLLPGLLCDADLWRDQVAALDDCHIPTLAADTIAAMADDVLRAAPPRFALAGLSMGGYVALAMMRQAPGRITRLCLAHTSARPDSARQTEGRHAAIAEVRAGGFDRVVARLLPLLVHPAGLADGALAERLLAMLHRVGPDAFIRQQLAAAGRPDSRASLAAIRVPTCVVAGDADRVIPPNHAAEIAAGIDGAAFVTLKDCGHLSPIEQPAGLTDILRRWLDDRTST